MIIGAQMFTLHKHCTNLDDLAESLARVADMGYTTVQLSGVCAYQPDWMAEQLKKNGLTCNLTHVGDSYIREDPDKCVADHNVFGCKYIGIGGMPAACHQAPTKEAGVQVFGEMYAAAAKRFAELGSMLMYHNHNWEFDLCSDGRTQLAHLAEILPADQMGFTLDTYWAKFAGYDPVSEIEHLKGRLPCVHYKDMEIAADGERRFTWVGNGILDFEKITAALETAGTKYIFIEQDNCYDLDEFECLKNSYKYLRSIGLA